jgi:hypothetical protein
MYVYLNSFIFIQDIGYLIGVIIGIKLLKHFDLSLKLIFALLCVSFVVDLFSFIFTVVFKNQNVFVTNLYSIVELVLVSFFYITIINSLFFRRLIFLLLLIYILTSLFYFYTNSLSSMAYYKIAALETFLISCYALSFFIHSMNYNPKKNSTELPFFWINSGILIYYMPFILIFLFFEYLNKTSSEFLIRLINNSTNILTLVFITLIIIGFLKSKSQNPNVNLNS